MKENPIIAKIREYIQMGYTIQEASRMAGAVFVSCETTRKARASKPKEARTTWQSLAFGCEIECFIPSENEPELQSAMIAEGLATRKATYGDGDEKELYKISEDGSIEPDEGTISHEVISPILSDYKGLVKLSAVLDKKGARVNRSCGFHVHVGVEKLNDAQKINVVRNYQKLEKLIDTFMPPSRRGRNNDQYCDTILDFDLSNCKTWSDVQREIPSRYYKVNVWSGHGTIEFRQHGGTTNKDKMINWISFCRKLVAFSCYNLLEAEISDIQKVPFISKAEKTFFANRIAELD